MSVQHHPATLETLCVEKANLRKFAGLALPHPAHGQVSKQERASEGEIARADERKGGQPGTREGGREGGREEGREDKGGVVVVLERWTA